MAWKSFIKQYISLNADKAKLVKERERVSRLETCFQKKRKFLIEYADKQFGIKPSLFDSIDTEMDYDDFVLFEFMKSGEEKKVIDKYKHIKPSEQIKNIVRVRDIKRGRNTKEIERRNEASPGGINQEKVDLNSSINKNSQRYSLRIKQKTDLISPTQRRSARITAINHRRIGQRFV